MKHVMLLRYLVSFIAGGCYLSGVSVCHPVDRSPNVEYYTM